MRLRNQTLRAIFWVALAQYSTKAISFLIQLVLARLLAPEAFGLMAVTLVVLDSTQIFQRFGLTQALITRKERVEEASHAAFFMSATIGLILSGVVMLSAPLIATFLNEDALSVLLRTIAPVLFISSLATVPSALIQRDLKFRTLTWPQLVGTIGLGSVAISLGLLGFGVWSIVWGYITQACINTLLLWLLVDWRPSQKFDVQLVKELFHYGRQVISISLGAFLHSNVDTIIVQKFLGTASVGHYNLAFTMGNSLPRILMNAIYPVMLPTYSKIQNEPARIANIHLKVVKIILVSLVPMVLLAALLAREGILILYGSVWQEAIVPLQIFFVYGVIAQISTTNAPILLVTNKLKEWKYIVYLNLLLFVLLSIPSIRIGGLIGMSVLMTLIGSICCLLALYVNCQTLQTPLSRYMKLLFQPIVASIAAWVVTTLISGLVGLHFQGYGREQLLENTVTLATKASITLASYLVAIYWLDPEVRSLLAYSAPKLSKGAILKFLSND